MFQIYPQLMRVFRVLIYSNQLTHGFKISVTQTVKCCTIEEIWRMLLLYYTRQPQLGVKQINFEL